MVIPRCELVHQVAVSSIDPPLTTSEARIHTNGMTATQQAPQTSTVASRSLTTREPVRSGSTWAGRPSATVVSAGVVAALIR